MKRFIILLTAVLAIAGCTKNPLSGIEAGEHSDIVGFSTGYVTRGTPIENASGLTDIGTFGYHTRQTGWSVNDLPDLMFNRRLQRDGTEWKYDGAPVEWNGEMASDLFTFFAYAPYASAGNGITVNGNASTGGIPTLTYTVPEDVTAQPDIMVAVPRQDIVRPASGQVSLSMRHALTTVGFQVAGNGEKIAGLSISGISMTGTLKMDGGNIVWTDLDTPSSGVDFSASINFDDGEDYYTATPAMSTNLMKGEGYLMMVPQMLEEGAMLTVTYDDGTTLDIDINPYEWLPGKRIIYELTIVPEGIILVDPSNITLPYSQTYSVIRVDCSDGRGNQLPDLEWTLASSAAWLTLSLDSNVSTSGPTVSGQGSQTVYVFAPQNTTNANRTANVSLDGSENVVTVVEQVYTAAQRFARSNIVMYIANGNKILTFAEKEADHKTDKSVTYYDAATSSTVTGTVPAIPANVQGLHFRWGSLVGITSDGPSGTLFNNGTTGLAPSHVVFWPAEYAPRVPSSWVFNNNSVSVAGQVPFIGGGEIGQNHRYAFEGYPGGTGPGFDAAAGKGDICRYISDMGWVDGKWRMPTSDEIRELLFETSGFYQYDGKIVGEWDTNYETISGTGSGNKYGYYQIPDIRVVGKAVTGLENIGNSIPNPGFAKVVFPAAGARNGHDGSLSAQGNYGYHWSASSNAGDFALTLDYHDLTNHPANNLGRNNGFSVRCIME